MNRFNIAYDTEGYSFEASLLDYNIVKDGYIFPLDPLFLKDEEHNIFIEELLEEFKNDNTEIFDFSSGKHHHINYKNDSFFILIRGDKKEKTIYAFGKTQQVSEFIFKLHKKCATDDSETQIFMTTYGEKTYSKLLGIEDIEKTSKSYYPYIDTETMFQQFFTGGENILILAGKPGLGKTRLFSLMMKYAYENIEHLPYDKMFGESDGRHFLSIGKVKNTEVLASDQFWETIQKAKHDFIILDDLDFMLTKREADVRSEDDARRNKFLSYFLPFTDGIEENKTKFVITTNQTYEHMDTALLRKGRLFDILELRNLKSSEAKAIWLENGLKESDFEKIFDSSDVNPADLGSEIKKKTNKRIKNNSKNYLLEDGISKIQKAKKNKKISL